jgi:cellulose synthase/poly-beta-1,6-N-acetylglucosamine synthase-like glycosyltransferase
MVQLGLTLVLWGCFGLVCYVYLAYPAIIWLLSRCWGQRHFDDPGLAAELPSVSLLIAAYNEEAEIEKRIQTALAADYPSDKLEIIIASDGSSDNTAAIVRGYASRGVRLFDYKQRRGKAAVLNNTFPELKGDIVLLSDANTMIDSLAMRRIVTRFTDKRVGVVCGRLVLTDGQTGHNVDSLYWKYETFLKQCEGRLGALLGANGAIYAIRRELLRPIPGDTIIDDFVIPLQARLRTGCGIVYESRAVAYEETPLHIGDEFHRRCRIGAGGFQSICMLWPLLSPRQGWTAFTFLSHKVLRWLCPFLLLGMLISNLCLIGEPVYGALLMAQALFYLISAATAWLPARMPRLLRLTTMFTSMNLALLVGFWRWFTGQQKGVWKRTARFAEVGRAPG